jgi:hypothetical protein
MLGTNVNCPVIVNCQVQFWKCAIFGCCKNAESADTDFSSKSDCFRGINWDYTDRRSTAAVTGSQISRKRSWMLFKMQNKLTRRFDPRAVGRNSYIKNRKIISVKANHQRYSKENNSRHFRREKNFGRISEKCDSNSSERDERQIFLSVLRFFGNLNERENSSCSMLD